MSDLETNTTLIQIQKDAVLEQFKKVKEVTDNPVKIEMDMTIFDVPDDPTILNNENFSYDRNEGILHDKNGIILKRLIELGYMDDEQ